MTGDTITRDFSVTITRAADGSRNLRAVASTASVDRAGDIVDQGSWRLDRFRANPVILLQHDHAAPIARADGIGVTGGKLVVDIAFPPPGASARSDEAWNLVEHGVIRALSVGFRPGDREPLGNGRGFRFRNCELLEVSVVSVPANAECLIQAPRPNAKTDPGAEARKRIAAAKLRAAGLSPGPAATRIAQARARAEAAERAAIIRKTS